VFFYCLAKSTAIKPLIAANTPFLLAMMPNYFSVTSVKFTMTAAALTENGKPTDMANATKEPNDRA
jgi:hypothetical protein